MIRKRFSYDARQKRNEYEMLEVSLPIVGRVPYLERGSWSFQTAEASTK